MEATSLGLGYLDSFGNSEVKIGSLRALIGTILELKGIFILRLQLEEIKQTLCLS